MCRSFKSLSNSGLFSGGFGMVYTALLIERMLKNNFHSCIWYIVAYVCFISVREIHVRISVYGCVTLWLIFSVLFLIRISYIPRSVNSCQRHSLMKCTSQHFSGCWDVWTLYYKITGNTDLSVYFKNSLIPLLALTFYSGSVCYFAMYDLVSPVSSHCIKLYLRVVFNELFSRTKFAEYVMVYFQ